MSTTIPATPMPNATGTETKPAPMVEVKALEWETYPLDGGTVTEGLNRRRTYLLRAMFPWGRAVFVMEKDGAFSSHGLQDLDDAEFRSIDQIKEAIQAFFSEAVLAYLHPAPATLADETLRAEEVARHNQLSIAFQRMKAAEARAEAAEAKLAAISQPAPVVEDGTAREAEALRLRDHLSMAVGNAAWMLRKHHADEFARELEITHSALAEAFARATLALEGQNAEASLRAALNIDDLNQMFARIPEGSYSADARGEGWEVRAIDTDPTNVRHWPYRLCASIAGQKAGCDPDVFGFIAGVLNAWPTISAALARSIAQSGTAEEA